MPDCVIRNVRRHLIKPLKTKISTKNKLTQRRDSWVIHSKVHGVFFMFVVETEENRAIAEGHAPKYSDVMQYHVPEGT